MKISPHCFFLWGLLLMSCLDKFCKVTLGRWFCIFFSIRRFSILVQIFTYIIHFTLIFAHQMWWHEYLDRFYYTFMYSFQPHLLEYFVFLESLCGLVLQVPLAHYPWTLEPQHTGCCSSLKEVRALDTVVWWS